MENNVTTSDLKDSGFKPQVMKNYNSKDFILGICGELVFFGHAIAHCEARLIFSGQPL